jgi:hypothetical protein
MIKVNYLLFLRPYFDGNSYSFIPALVVQIWNSSKFQFFNSKLFKSKANSEHSESEANYYLYQNHFNQQYFMKRFLTLFNLADNLSNYCIGPTDYNRKGH